MTINKILLKGFRNHKNLEIEIPQYLKIEGPNGSGKSSILEAIYLLSTTKSTKTTRLNETINYETEFAHIKIYSREKDYMFDDELEMIIAVNPQTQRTNRVTRVNKTKKSINSFAGNFTSVLFTPEDLNILLGSPSERRRWIDTLLYQVHSDYRVNSTQYTKALKSRNRVLERIAEGMARKESLEFWNEEVLKNAKNIQRRRKELFEFVNEVLLSKIEILDPTGHEFEIKYLNKTLDEEILENNYPKELRAKKTLAGPHLDDFEGFINSKNIQKYGSRGQQRTFVLALKLCELDYIKQITTKKPILLLDDIMSELDLNHQTAVENIVAQQQTIITTAQTSRDELYFYG